MKITHPLSGLLVLLVVFTSGWAQTDPPSASTSKEEVIPVRVDTPPKIDGKLDDEIWKDIPPITNFLQVWPNDGTKATEDSEVRIAYDRDFLYFAFKMNDKNPELIRAKNMERGGRNDRDDHVYISLDTYQDKRNAYLFEINALGTQDDAMVTDEAITIDSFSWDAVFSSETEITDEGWTLEVAIPFRQLRFPKGEVHDFGLMLSRTINRKNERVLWPHIGLEFDNFGNGFGSLMAVSQYGTLKGLKDIRQGKNIEIKPFVNVGSQKVRPDLSMEDTDDKFTKDVGFDFKYGISSNLTLDLTVNTDFAQVEADNVQLNLTRFNLFFPEKREFFLERSGLFEHGNSRSTQTFFSRRIGLTNQILAGSRLTGQIGRFSVGLLNIETGEKMKEVFGPQSTNNTVARIRTNFGPRTTAGIIFTNLDEEGHFNRAVGADAQYRFWSSSEVNTWYTKVYDTDNALNDDAGHISLRLQNQKYGATGSFTSVGEDYNPALGFVRRRDMRQFRGGLSYSPVVEIASLPMIRRFNFQADYDYIEGQDREIQSTSTEFQVATEFQKRDGFQLGFERQFERLDQSFFIRPDAEIPMGDYTFNRYTISVNSDASRRVFASTSFIWGDFFNGVRTDFGGMAGWRQSKHLTLEGGINHSMINLPISGGEFDATTISMSILGAVSRKLFAKALLQYDNFTRDFQANIRVDWIHTPGGDLFLVYNTSNHFRGNNEVLFDPRKDAVLNSRVAVIKLTYLFLL